MVPEDVILAGTALIIDSTALLEADTCDWVRDPPSGNTSRMQDTFITAMAATQILYIIFFIISIRK
jgi:hypothetical protein